MNGDIAEAKRRLPLPELLHRLGLGEHAKRSAMCPFHDDQHNSFSIWCNEAGQWLWKCHAGCGQGDEITFLELHKGMSNGDAIKLFLELAGIAEATRTPFKPKLTMGLEWRASVEAFTEKHAEQLAKYRGYSIETCSWLKKRGLIGLFYHCFAFPVHDDAGDVVALHYRLKDCSWRYSPQGTKVRPLVIGGMATGDTIHLFESYWDAFAFMDQSGERSGIIITRGASNGALVAGLTPSGSTVYLWTQNDPAGEKWENDICANTKALMKRVKIPAPHKDLNNWTHAGTTAKSLLDAMVSAKAVREAERPLIQFRSPLQLKNFTPPHGILLLGDFHIVKGSVFVIGGAPRCWKVACRCRVGGSRRNWLRMVWPGRPSEIQDDDRANRKRRISPRKRVSRTGL